MNISPAAICDEKKSKLTSSRKSVQASTSAGNRDHVKVLGSSVISTVNNSASRKTKSHSELVTSSTTTTYI